MKTAGVTTFIAFVLIGIGTAAAEQSTTSLSIPAHHLSSKQVKIMVETARTAQDHRELAQYFRQEAQRMREQEQYHMEMAAFYRLHPVPKPLVSMLEHCKYLADQALGAAIAADEMASVQERIAEQITQSGQPYSAALLDASSPGVAAPQELTGVVTDDLCKRTHMLPGHSEADCSRACVRAGSKYALVAGDKVYVLKGDPKQIEQFAGQKVTVNGDVKKGSMSVQVIAEVK